MKLRKFLLPIHIIALLIILIIVMFSAAYANTDGNELTITPQADRLILQLGLDWAGVEFELRTDAGIFPVPVVVDSNGILSMDLGGSSIYILSNIHSSVAIPEPPLSSNIEETTEQSEYYDYQNDTPTLFQRFITALFVIVLIVIGVVVIIVSIRLKKNVSKRRYKYGDYKHNEDSENEE